MTDKHSFIIPAYGDSPYLEACIQSLMQQTVKSPIFITTSTPSDFILSTAQKYQLDVIINFEVNAGISRDWNFALAQATTSYVTLAHQDEVFQAEYTASLFQHIHQNPTKNIIILFTNYQEIIGNALQMKPSFHASIKKLLLLPFLLNPNISSKKVKRAVLSLGTPICCSSVTFHKDLMLDFSFSDQFKVTLDWHAWLTLAEKQGYFSYINKKLVGHRIHPGAETYHQIQSGLRYHEEMAIFSSIWGKTMAKLLMKMYVHGHSINTKPQ